MTYIYNIYIYNDHEIPTSYHLLIKHTFHALAFVHLGLWAAKPCVPRNLVLLRHPRGRGPAPGGAGSVTNLWVWPWLVTVSKVPHIRKSMEQHGTTIISWDIRWYDLQNYGEIYPQLELHLQEPFEPMCAHFLGVSGFKLWSLFGFPVIPPSTDNRYS